MHLSQIDASTTPLRFARTSEIIASAAGAHLQWESSGSLRMLTEEFPTNLMVRVTPFSLIWAWHANSYLARVTNCRLVRLSCRMLAVGCIVAFALTFAGAIAGVLMGGIAAGMWGGAVGLLLGIIVMLLALWVFGKAKGGLPE